MPSALAISAMDPARRSTLLYQEVFPLGFEVAAPDGQIPARPSQNHHEGVVVFVQVIRQNGRRMDHHHFPLTPVVKNVPGYRS